ncbi:MAG: hypothetical protein MSIBF_02560 [Candidatus Altiarchaeales archaeon IMC4]|nr:MAG: hypothetical protein MSIBF_02560 [Candidatus Altiarchaeales archaeon IMC4]
MSNLVSEIGRRVSSVRELMGDFDALIVSDPRNILYLTGRETGTAILTRDSAELWVKDLYSKLYEDVYSAGSYPLEIEEYKKDAVKDFIKKSGFKNIGIGSVSVSSYDKLKGDMPCSLSVTDIVEQVRSVKSPYEIERIKKSCAIAKKGMRRAYEVVREGTTEIMAAAKIEYAIRKAGSEKPPFETGMLLASGKNSADVHARAGRHKINDCETVVVDLGACFENYHSDMTRTIAVGAADKKTLGLLEFVDNLRAETIGRITPGDLAGNIHSFVEGEIKRHGFEFYHSTGHGVGLEIHEAPNIGQDSKDILKEGMVFTVEPGIYIPGKFGIRFEDTVLLTKNCCRILTK